MGKGEMDQYRWIELGCYQGCFLEIWYALSASAWMHLHILLSLDIHPLALKDVFHTRSQTRSKADYYNKHLFLRILCHELGDPDAEPKLVESAAAGSTLTDGPRSSSPLPFEDGEGYEILEKDDKTLFESLPSSRKSTLKNRGGKRKGKDLEEGLRKAPSMFSLNQNVGFCAHGHELSSNRTVVRNSTAAARGRSQYRGAQKG